MAGSSPGALGHHPQCCSAPRKAQIPLSGALLQSSSAQASKVSKSWRQHDDG